MTNMIDSLGLVLNSIKLDSYGASQRFVGYFERAGKYKTGMAEAAADFFCGYYEGSFDELVMVSSLHIDTDQVGHSGDTLQDQQDIELVKSPLSAGLVRSLSYIEEFGQDYESEFYDAAIDAVWNDFRTVRIGEIDPDDFRNLLVSKLLVYGLKGHCFLVFENHGLAYYPSDDIGFGVVALRDDADFSGAHEFLRQAGTLEGFRSVIQR